MISYRLQTDVFIPYPGQIIQGFKIAAFFPVCHNPPLPLLLLIWQQYQFIPWGIVYVQFTFISSGLRVPTISVSGSHQW